MSDDLDLYQVVYQDNLRSKPVRDNFQLIENNYNALRAEVYASIASTASEVTTARDNLTTLSDNIHLRKVYNNRVVGADDFKVTALNTAAMAVNMATGAGIVNGVGVKTTSVLTSATIATAASGKHRMDAIAIATDNAVYVKNGPEVSTSSAVEYPSILSTEMILAHFTVGNTTSAITNTLITDDRISAVNPFKDVEVFDSVYYYSANGTINTMTAQDKEGIINTYSVSYSGATLDSIGVTIDGNRYKTVYTYNGTLGTVNGKTITIIS